MGIQSSFSLLVAANEAFGYTHEQTLDSNFSIIMSMFREYNVMMNERNRGSKQSLAEGEEWVEITDFETGNKKRIKKVKSI